MCIAIFLIIPIISTIKKHEAKKAHNKRIEEGKHLYNNGKYIELAELTNGSRTNLEQMVPLQEDLLRGLLKYSAYDYIYALRKFGFLTLRSTEKHTGTYSTKTKKQEIICDAIVVRAICNRLDLAIQENGITDGFIMYHLLYDLGDCDDRKKYIKEFATYCKEQQRHIIEPSVTIALGKYQKVIGISDTDKVTSRYYEKAEMDLFNKMGIIYRKRPIETFPSETELQTAQLGKHSLYFYPQSHAYFVDGIEVPSVTQLLKLMDCNYADYTGVPSTVLANAARKGTMLHAAIQRYEEKRETDNSIELQHYLLIKSKYDFNVKECEKFIIIFAGKVPICAGKFDLIIDINGHTALADIKRTYRYHKSDVEKQLNMYRLGYEQTYGKQIEELYCIHLREEKADFIQVAIDENNIKNIIFEYYNRAFL